MEDFIAYGILVAAVFWLGRRYYLQITRKEETGCGGCGGSCGATDSCSTDQIELKGK